MTRTARLLSEPRRTPASGVLTALAPLAFVLPLALLLTLSALFSPQATLRSAIELSGGIIPPLLRSLLAGIGALILTTPLAVSLAVVSTGPIFEGRSASVYVTARALALSVTPLLTGPVAFAFLWDGLHLRLISAALGRDLHSPFGLMVVDAVAQTLRYAPLEAWLLMLTALAVDPGRVMYARQAGFSRWDFVRNELHRPWALIVLVVSAFVFQDTSNDVVVSYLALRPSPANGTELVGHMLGRVFAMLSTGVSARAATASVLLLCLPIGAVTCFSFVLASATMPALASCIASGTARGSQFLHKYRLEAILVSSLCVVIYCPFIWPMISHTPEFGELLSSFGPTLVAAFLVSTTAWLTAAFLVYRLRESAEGPASQRRLGWAGLAAIGVGFFPSIGPALSIYVLLFRLPFGGLEAFTWGIAETIKLVPILAIFSIPLALGLADRRLAYSQVAGIHPRMRWWLEFLRPAWLTHAALLLIGWNWVLNEAVISGVFQSNFRSFSELVLRATSGRSAAYGVASALVTIQATIFGLLCLVWSEIGVRSWQRHA